MLFEPLKLVAVPVAPPLVAIVRAFCNVVAVPALPEILFGVFKIFS